MNSTHAMVFISPRISATSHCITMVQRRYLTDVDRGRAWLQQRIAVHEVARRRRGPFSHLQTATVLAGDRKSARQAPVRSTPKDQTGGSLHHKTGDNGMNQHRQAHQRAAEGSDTNQRVRVHHKKKSPPRSPPPCPSPSKAAKADPCPQKGTPGLVQAPCAEDTCPLVQGDVY